ncbi:MAG: amidohydrolase family protein [Deinococcales bacterium]|nr:amidohydrolase family protein [Chitinophagaceae bacterium]
MAYLKYQADYLFTGKEILPSTAVLITDENGVVQNITNVQEAGDDIKQLQGLLTPGFINCHCHLELSHMKGLIPPHTGLVDFILNILQLRNNSEDSILQAIANSESEMKNNGIVAVGDISNNALTLLQKRKGNLQYHNFIEVSGFSPAHATARFNNGMLVYQAFKEYFPTATSLVPHAPYSLSKQLFKLIDAMATNPISTIHNQETKDENAFFLSGKGSFNNLYQSIGIDITTFHQPTNTSSLQSVVPLMQQPKKIILVHDTFISQADIDFLNQNHLQQQFIFCLCVNANQYIENELPPIDLLLQNNCNMVIGTDSLASNHQLCVLSEIKTICQNFPNIPLQDVLTWATFNGAKALQMDVQLGSFNIGKKPGIVLIDALTPNGGIAKNSIAKVID